MSDTENQEEELDSMMSSSPPKPAAEVILEGFGPGGVPLAVGYEMPKQEVLVKKDVEEETDMAEILAASEPEETAKIPAVTVGLPKKGSTPPPPAPKSKRKPTLFGVAPNANHEEGLKSEDAPMQEEEVTALMPAVMVGIPEKERSTPAHGSDRPTPTLPPPERHTPTVIGVAPEANYREPFKSEPGMPKSTRKPTVIGIAPEANYKEPLKNEPLPETLPPPKPETLPPPKSHKPTVLGIAPEANYKEPLKNEPLPEKPGSAPPLPPLDLDKITSPETPASKRAMMLHSPMGEAQGVTQQQEASTPAVAAGNDPPPPPSADPGKAGSDLAPPPPFGDPAKITAPETPVSKRVMMLHPGNVEEGVTQEHDWNVVTPGVIPVDPKMAATMAEVAVQLPSPPMEEVAQPAQPRGWGAYALVAAVILVIGLVGTAVMMSGGEAKKVTKAPVASAVPAAVSSPQPSATSPLVVPVAESDESQVASQTDAGSHDASSVASATSAPTVTVTRTPMVRGERGNRRVVSPPATSAPVVVPVVTAAPTATVKPVEPETKPSDPKSGWRMNP